jgi:hypothetical protein
LKICAYIWYFAKNSSNSWNFVNNSRISLNCINNAHNSCNSWKKTRKIHRIHNWLLQNLSLVSTVSTPRNVAVMKQKSSIQCMYYKIKIHQTSFHCVQLNFKIDVDIAIEKTHSHENSIYWPIWQFFFKEWWEFNTIEARVWLDKHYLDSESIKLTVEKWFAKFKRGEMSIEDDARSGRPKQAVID